jgi:hypothetical protein
MKKYDEAMKFAPNWAKLRNFGVRYRKLRANRLTRKLRFAKDPNGHKVPVHQSSATGSKLVHQLTKMRAIKQPFLAWGKLTQNGRVQPDTGSA